MPDQPLLLIEDRDAVRVLTLNRPEKRNALSRALRDAIVSALTTAAEDASVGAVVITGAGSTFCAGFDLAELMSATNPAELFSDSAPYHRTLHRFPKPLIAAVNGPALAGGFDVALLCDVRLCVESATFGQPQVQRGIPASYELMADVLPTPLADELCLTGRIIDAATAARVGLVTRVVDANELVGDAVALAATAAGAGGAAAKAQILRRRPQIW